MAGLRRRTAKKNSSTHGRPKELARLARRGLRWFLCAVLAWYGLCAATLVILRWLPPPATAVQAQRRVESWLRKGKYRKRYAFVPLSKIPPHFQHAVIAAEDGRFYQHHGFDWQEMRKVMEDDLKRGRLGRGGSTITQQLAKNLFLTTHRSFIRKTAEFILTPLAELILPKARILELYLNVIEWGPGVYGADAAARYHYGIGVGRVSREQAARLAACIPSPLHRRPQSMNGYSDEILARMNRMGW